MDIERRVSALEKKCVVANERSLLFRELYEPVLGDPQAYDVMREIAEQLTRAKPEFHKRLEAGGPITDEELSQAGIDPKLWRLANSIIKEKLESIRA